MEISEKGLDLIISFEGFSSKPYPDPATKAEPYTIGYGSTRYENGSKVSLSDMEISKDRAKSLLETTVNEKTKILNSLVKVQLTQNEFDAITCWCYNVGEGNV